MALIVDLFDPVAGPYSYLNAIECDAAGFESYRKELWGSQSLVKRGARFFPQLNSADLFVYPADLSAFAEECRMIESESETIANEIWGPNSDGAANIRDYMRRFTDAIKLAEQRAAGVCIS